MIQIQFFKKCRSNKKQNLYVAIVTAQLQEEEEDEFDDNSEDAGLSALRRTFEQKYKSLENILNKKLVKGMNQANLETKTRLNHMQSEVSQILH